MAYEVTPEQFGTCSRDETQAAATANTLAIQAAINSFGASNSGVVRALGGYPINDTLLLTSGVKFVGGGWGRSNILSNPSSYLKWLGPPDVPMVLVNDYFGASVENIRFIGNSQSKPSCAIELRDDGVHNVSYTTLRRLWIGHMFGLDTDQANQFTRGIVWSGSLNGDPTTCELIKVVGCDEDALWAFNRNASNIEINTLHVQHCKTAVRCSASVNITNMFAYVTGYVFELDKEGDIYARHLASEKSGGIVRINGDSASIVLRDGGFQAQNGYVVPDGRIVDVGAASTWRIVMENYGLQTNGADTDPPVIKFRLYNTSGGLTNGHFSFVGGRNVHPNNLECGTLIGPRDTRVIDFRPAVPIGMDNAPRQTTYFDYNLPENRSFQSWRNDFAGKVNVFGGPLNIRRLTTSYLKPTVTASTGIGTTPYSYRVSALSHDGGETDASLAGTCLNATTLAPGVAENRVEWVASLGAVGYRIYGRTTGAEQLLTTIMWDDFHGGYSNRTVRPPFWIDDGSITPVGAVPAFNTTGGALVEGALKLPNAGGSSGWKTPMYLGAYALWVDSAGALRIKSGAPTSDTDGTIVGSQ